MNNSVVVIGGLHHNTLGVLRSLGIAGIKDTLLILIGHGLDFISRSKFIKKKNIIKLDSDNELLDLLLKIGPEFTSKPVVISSSDSSIAVIDNHYETLKKFFLLPNANDCQGEINKLMDKCGQNKIAEQCGLIFPETIQGNSENDMASWNTYPSIIKPIESILGSKADIKICNNKNELTESIRMYDGRSFLVQPFVDKDYEFQLIGCSLEHGQKIILPGFTKKIRHSLKCNTGFLQYKNIKKVEGPDLIQNVSNFLKFIKYEGLFSIEFLRTKDGKNLFLEINLRSDGNVFCVTESGVNLPYCWVLYKNGKKIANSDIKHEISFMCELEDFKFCIGAHKNMLLWMWQFINSSHSVFNIKDLSPFFHKFAPMLKNGLMKVPKKIAKIFS